MTEKKLDSSQGWRTPPSHSERAVELLLQFVPPRVWCRCLQAFETADRANTETDKNFVTTNKALNKAVHFIVSNRA